MTGKIKFWIIGTILIVILGIGSVYLINHRNAFKTTSDVMDIIPSNSIAFYKGKDFLADYDKLRSMPFWKSHLEAAFFKRMDLNIQMYDSIAGKYKFVEEAIKREESVWSLHKVAKNKVALLFISRTSQKVLAEEIQEILEDFYKRTIKARNFSNYTIYDVPDGNNNFLLSFAILDNFIVISKNALLVEDAIRTYINGEGNKKLHAEIAEEDLLGGDIYINYKMFPDLRSVYLKNEHFDKNKPDFGGIGVYKLDLAEESFHLRGNIMNSDSTVSTLSLFQNQKAGRIQIPNVVSEKVSAFVCYRLSNYKRFYKRLQDRFYNSNAEDDYNQAFQEFEEKYGLNIFEEMVPLIHGEFAFSVSDPVNADLDQGKSVYIRVVDTKKASQLFTGRVYPVDPSDTFMPAHNEQYRNYNIFYSKNTSVFRFLFGEEFSNYKPAYFTIIRDVLVFNPDAGALKKTIDDFENLQTLHKYPVYNRIRRNLSTDMNYLVYVNPFRALSIPELYIKNDFLKQYKNGVKQFKRWEAFAFQVANNSNSYYSEITAVYDRAERQSRENLWEAELDTTFSKKPYIVKNHQNNTFEVVVFDDKNNMYLISPSGKLLWKKGLVSEVVGDVHQVDLYNNDKLQYLFTTKTHVYLVDRLGRNVANYPIKLSANATTGVSVIEIKGKLRYFIGTDNNYVFGYDKSGKPLQGWSPVRVNGSLDYPLKYFIHKNEFRIFGVTDKGSFYFWNHRGQQTTKTIELKTRFTNPFRMHFGGADDKTFLTSVDTAGNTIFIRLNLTVDIEKRGSWTDALYFDYFDLLGGDDREMVYAEKDLLMAYSINGDIRHSVYLDQPISGKPYFIKLEEKQHIAYLNKETGLIYLSDLEGVNRENFPVSATTPFEFFDINKDGNTELIAGKANRIFVIGF